MTKNYKTVIDEIINKSPVEEDAPVNAVGDGSNVALPPTHEPGVKKKKKKDVVLGTLKRKVMENNDNNNVIFKQILDGIDSVQRNEEELTIEPIKEKQSLVDKYKLRNGKKL